MRFSVLLLVLGLLFHVEQSSAAVTNIEATVTWTNMVAGVTNGDTITVNSSIRRYTNGVLNAPALWILSTNIVGHAATNTVIHFNTYSAGLGLDYISFSTAAGVHLTNAARFVSIIGSNLTITLSAGVGTVTYVTNVFDQYRPVVHPAGSLPTAAARTNNQSGLFSILSDNYATNVVANSVPGLTNLLDRVSYQESTNKTFRSTTNYGGLLDGARATNFTSLSGSNGTFADLNLQRGSISNAVGITGTNASLTNVTLRHFKFIDGRPEGTNAGITNGFTVGLTNINSVSSNHINYGNALRSEGPGANSLNLGSNAVSGGLRSVSLGNNSFAGSNDAFTAGTDARSTNQFTVTIGNIATNFGYSSVVVGYDSQGTNLSVAVGPGTRAGEEGVAIGRLAEAGVRSIAIGGEDTDATAYETVTVGVGSAATAVRAMVIGTGTAAHSNSAAIGPPDHDSAFVATTTTNQIVVGTANHRVWIPGVFAAAAVSNFTAQVGSTNRFPAGSDISFGRSTITTVANGHNTIAVNTNVYVDLTGSPTAAWTWGGITGGNRDGKLLVVVNNTGYAADIIHNSGTEPTAALRITTPTGTNITCNNAGSALFVYNATSSRWILLNVFNTATPAASATNALASLSTNGVQVTAAWTNLNLITKDGLQVLTTNASGNVSMELRAPGYTIIGNTAATFAPADSTTYYQGASANVPTTTYDLHSFDVPRAGTLKRVFIKVGAIAGASTEAVSHYIRLNDTTDITVDTTATYNTAQTNIVNGALSQALVAGDRVALKIATPAWATNPTGVRYYVLLYIE